MNKTTNLIKGVIVCAQGKTNFHVHTLDGRCLICSPRGLLKKKKRSLFLRSLDYVSILVLDGYKANGLIYQRLSPDATYNSLDLTQYSEQGHPCTLRTTDDLF